MFKKYILWTAHKIFLIQLPINRRYTRLIRKQTHMPHECTFFFFFTEQQKQERSIVDVTQQRIALLCMELLSSKRHGKPKKNFFRSRERSVCVATCTRMKLKKEQNKSIKIKLNVCSTTRELECPHPSYLG